MVHRNYGVCLLQQFFTAQMRISLNELNWIKEKKRRNYAASAAILSLISLVCSSSCLSGNFQIWYRWRLNFIHMRFFSWFQRHYLFFLLNHCVCFLFVSHSLCVWVRVVVVFFRAATAAINTVVDSFVCRMARHMKSNLWTMKLWKLIEPVALQPPNHSNNSIDISFHLDTDKSAACLLNHLNWSFFGMSDAVCCSRCDVVCNHSSPWANCWYLILLFSMIKGDSLDT